MKADELGKDTEFTLLHLRKEVVHEVMDFWKFKDPSQMMEAGVLLLQSLSVAAKWPCEKLYFSVIKEGKEALYEFRFADLIRAVTDPNRPEGSTHGVEVHENQPVVEEEKEIKKEE